MMEAYGAIESFEVLPKNNPQPKGRAKEDRYMLVTYADSRSALRAISKKRDDYLIALAETWKQPDAPQPLSSLARNCELSLNRLNDNMLIKIFRYLDFEPLLNLSHVCDRFKDLIRRYVFPQHPKIELNFAQDCFPKEWIWYIAVNILPHRKRIKLLGTVRTIDDTRLLHVCIKNMRKNLVRLDMTEVFFTQNLYDHMKSVLKNLKVLFWENPSTRELDFINCCPALEKLYLIGNMSLRVNAGKWKSLKSAVLSVRPGDSFSQFCSNNAQLKRLKIGIGDQHRYIRNVCAFLTGIETLKIVCVCRYFSSAADFKQLVELERLKTLKLKIIGAGANDYENLIEIIGRMKSLEKLEINCYANFNFATLGRKLGKLKYFHISASDATEERLMEFVRPAPRLTTLEIHNPNLHLSNDFLRVIAKTRESFARARQMPERVTPMQILIGYNLPSLRNINGIVSVKERNNDKWYDLM